MSALKHIDEKVCRLLAHANTILAIKDQLFDLLKDAVPRGGQLTFEEAKAAYARSREMNDLYRAWYAEAWYLVKSNLPERLEEFERAYAGAALQLGNLMDEEGSLQRRTMVLFEKCMSPQIGFVRAIPQAIGAKALSLRGLLSRDLMDDELAAARHHLDHGYVREAGVVAGVVLESHLKQLCAKHGVQIGDRDTLGQLNDKMKPHYPDAAEYRRVQFLNEIRISCAHDKTSAPDDARVSELISGTHGFITTVI